MRRFGTAMLLAVLVTGCAASDGYRAISCRGDDECAEGEVCFPEGCGDPGQNIVVEVIPNPKAGLHAQDFRVEQLRSQQNIELFDPSLLQGLVRREEVLTSSPINYSAPVTLRVTGESLLIPGVVRRHEATLVPSDGSYSLSVGSGRYDVTLLPADPELPPLTEMREVEPGREVTLDFLLPASSELTRLTGKVVRLGELLVEAELEVQALDSSLRPLSQRVPVTSGTGDFALSLPPSAALLPSVLIRVAPTSAEASVPLKLFTVNPRLGIQEPLELGDYGELVTVGGRVLEPDGQPLEAATVYVQGKVGGGGQYRSGKVLTDEEGRFELKTLPGAPDGSPLYLYVIPLPGTSAGITVQAVTVPRTGALLSDVTCS
ncbi:MAG TPA: carboxypeptidase regulatory-like domain-containing protein, partial [Myxococcaceae bacterium]|nr:carboxypeptidase regulatory-like domain-containing protein [Myxococcaceae bacterium]